MKKLIPVLLPFGQKIYQTSSSGVSSDAAGLVEWVLKENRDKTKKTLDLGSGNGIIAIMLKYYRPRWTCLGLEIQQELVELARTNAALCGLQIEFLQGDLKEADFTGGGFDLIVSNPPYHSLGKHRLSPDRERTIARHELYCQQMDILNFLQQQLKPAGKAYLSYPADRVQEIEKNIKNIDLKINGKFILAGKNRIGIVLKKV
ncbi:MAG: methyltransferase [Candidatus Cloacimonetes bacterium]|nr:methyltransferase [Candidatus Cloacimonadota bacterium]